MSVTYKIRRPVPSDVEFMLKTWLREMRRGYPRNFPDRLFYKEYQEHVILPLTRKSNARVVCSPTDANYIAGFLVGEVYPEYSTAVVHFAYMRPPFRRMGLVKSMLQDMGLNFSENFEVVATHWTPYMDRFRVNELIYNPLTVYRVA